MKFANHLSHVETLVYYDFPLLEHWKQIDRITLSSTGHPDSYEGDMFDGTIEHWCDNYFSNFSVPAAVEFAKKNSVEIKFYGKDFLMSWQDQCHEYVQWVVIPVTEQQVTALVSPDLKTAITLRDVMLQCVSRPLYQVRANSYCYDVTEGDPILACDIDPQFMPQEGSYINLAAFAAWQETQT